MKYCRISLKPIKGNSKYKNYTDSEFRKLFQSLKVSPVLEFSRKDFFQQTPSKSKGMSISGVQQKLSLKINTANELEITPVNGTYLLKPSPETFPNASENEHCAMMTSHMLGVETAQCGLVSFNNGELVYITKRFDRQGVDKVHQEDLAQGFGIKSGEKYGHSYEAAGKLIHAMTNGKISVVFDFFCRVVHAYIIGNDDLHLKNLSLQRLQGNTGLFYDRLTPNYDCLFTQAFENISGSDALALDLLEDRKNKFYTMHDFKMLGTSIGLREKPITNFINSARTKESGLIDLIDRSSMPDSMKLNAKSIVSERIKALGF